MPSRKGDRSVVVVFKTAEADRRIHDFCLWLGGDVSTVRDLGVCDAMHRYSVPKSAWGAYVRDRAPR